MYKCNQIFLYFAIFLLTEQKPDTRSEIKILLKNLYAEHILVSTVFHNVDPTFETKKEFQKI